MLDGVLYKIKMRIKAEKFKDTLILIHIDDKLTDEVILKYFL